MKPTPITPKQWQKVLKALIYSTSSGFAGGFILSLAGALHTAHVHDLNLVVNLETAAIVGGVVGALNSLAVTVRQVFTVSV